MPWASSLLLSLSRPAIISRAPTLYDDRDIKTLPVLTPSQSLWKAAAFPHCSDPYLNLLKKQPQKKVSFVFLKILPGDREQEAFRLSILYTTWRRKCKSDVFRQLLMAVRGQWHIPGLCDISRRAPGAASPFLHEHVKLTRSRLLI